MTKSADSGYIHCTIESWVYSFASNCDLSDETQGLRPVREIHLRGITDAEGWLWPVDFELDKEWLEDELLYWRVDLELCVTRGVSLQHPRGATVTNAEGKSYPILGIFFVPLKPKTPRSLPSVGANLHLDQEAFGDLKDCLISAARNQELEVDVSLDVWGLERDEINELRWPKRKLLDIIGWQHRLVHQALGKYRDKPSQPER